MTERELVEIQGGAFPLLPFVTAAFGIGLGSIISGWSDFKEGFQEAFQQQLNA